MFMKRFSIFLLVATLCLSLFLGGCQDTEKTAAHKHTDTDSNGVCDRCYASLFVYFDLYTVHGQPTDIDVLEQQLKQATASKPNAMLLSTGNLWQDTTTAESSSWVNELGFSAASLGALDFENGEQHLSQIDKNATFPLLAINVYDRKTDKRAAYCTPSVMVEKSGIRIGVIGAIGDCYATINEDNCDEVYFKVGSELTSLVKKEAKELRSRGADFIVYLLHDGYGRNHTGAVQNVTDDQLTSYYDTALSDGYIDLVLEGGSDRSYRLQDSHGVYHLQNPNAISYAEIAFNITDNTATVRSVKLLSITESNDATTPSAPSSSSPSGDTTFPSGVTPPTSSGTIEPGQTNGSSGGTTTQTQRPTSPTQTPSVDTPSCKHKDSDDNGTCDVCSTSVLVLFDFYAVNDLHGKFADTDDNVGVDELTTYLKNAQKTDDNAVFLATGDMWQGSSESNLTKGFIITDWMNELDFAAMTLGNHEFDWGSEHIANNEKIAEFPILAINVYDRTTNKRVDYCEASTIVDMDGIQIGIIGAIGDCYSSIAVDKCDDVYFKVGRDLTSLVKAESDSLRARGADFIVYILHDGYGKSQSGSVKQVTSSDIASYYDTSLSDGYVDLVFEGHTHQGYRLKDQYGVYHLQHRGDNKGGISHVEIAINSVTYSNTVYAADLVTTGQYQSLSDDPLINELLKKYDDVISPANKVLGYNRAYRNSDYLCQLMADLYYDLGVEVWGDDYNIVLGGGFINTRSPYKLVAGDVTYADIQSIFPFDNQLMLCSVQGYNLRNKFFQTSNSSYFIGYGDYGASVRNNINNNSTYYVVVDSYTANYAPNRLTIIKEYDPTVFGRDLLAEYIKQGGLS